MKALVVHRIQSIAGVLGGFISWYFAHELGFYFTPAACHHPWILIVVHALFLVTCLGAGFMSWASVKASEKGEYPDLKTSSMIGMAAAVLFAVVILWQGLAAVILNSCER